MSDKKIAVVTGAAGGMGREIVERMVKAGFHVAAMDINKKGLDEVGQATKGSVTTYHCDQTDEKQARDTIGKIIKAHGNVDALVNTVGWAGTTRFREETADYWRKVIMINFESLLYVTQPILLNMIDRKKGKIVFIASDAGRVGTSGEAVYAGTKGAVIAFGKSLARENARYAINVNTICPGPTDTPLLREEMAEDPELVQRMVKIIPFRRVAVPADIAGVAVFLCSPDSDYMTGQTVSVSGGLTMV